MKTGKLNQIEAKYAHVFQFSSLLAYPSASPKWYWTNPNIFGTVQNYLDWSNLFGTTCINFGPARFFNFDCEQGRIIVRIVELDQSKFVQVVQKFFDQSK